MTLFLRAFVGALLVSMLCWQAARAQQINVTSVTPNPACAGATITATYSYTLPDPGTVVLYLNGPNTTNVPIGAAGTNGNNGSVQGTIPADRATGSYTVFIRRTSNILPTPINSPASSAFTVNALPAAPGVASLSYCVGATGVPPLTATGQNLKWYNVSTGGVGTTVAPTPSTGSTGTTNYYVSQTSAAGCEGPRATLAVTINPRPAQPTVVSSVSYCQNSTAPSLTSSVTSGSNLKWYTSLTGGTGTTVAPTPPTSSTGSTTYYVSQTNGNGCESDRSAITVTIKPSPAAPAVTTTPVTYCQGQTATPLSATPVSGAILNWFGPANNSLGSTAPAPPTTSPGTTFYSVSQTLSGCTSQVATITVTVNPKPAVPTTTPVGVCQGTTPVSLATGVTSGTNLRWYTTATGGTASTVAPTPSTGNVGSTPYYVSQVNSNGCESDRAVIQYTVNAYPAAPTVSPGSLTYCQNSTAVPLTATPAANATLSYYIVATGGTPYSTLTPSTTASNNYYVSQTLNGCESQQRATINVVINALPPLPAVTTPVTYCQLTVAAPLSATASTNNTLNWYGTNATGGTATTAAPTPSTTTDGAFTYYVSQKDPFGCESQRSPISVTIYPKPSAPTIPVQPSACLNTVPAPLTQSVTATGTLKWYTVSTGGIGSTVAPTLSTSAVGSTTYYVSQTNGNGCESDRAQITFTVNPLPAAPVTTPPLLYCQNATAQPLTATGVSGNILKWYYTASGGSPSASLTPSTTQTGSIIYYVSQTNGNGCESARASVTVTTTSRPVAPTVSATPVTYCQFAVPTSLTATPITGNTLNWYGPNATGGTASATATIPSTDPPVTTQYYVSQTDGNGCESSSRAAITVIVNPKPTAPTVTSITLCQNAPTVALVTAVTSGSNLKWYTAQNGGTGSMVAPTLSTAAVGSTTYYVSQTSANDCESDRSAIVVTVKPLPIAPTITPNPQNLCQSSVPTALTAIATGTLKWYNAAGQTFTSVTPSTNAVGPTSYSVSQIVDGCEGPKATLNVVVIPKPVAPTVTSSLTYCQAATSSVLTATGVSGNTLTWYDAGGVELAMAPSPPTSASGTTVYYVTQKDLNGCVSDRASISVRVKQKPAPPGTAPVEFCSDKVTPLTATFAAGTSPNWYGTNPAGTPTSTAPTPSTAVIGRAVPYYVSQTLDGCESAQAFIDVTIKVLPAAPTVSSTPVTYCQDATASPLSATGVTNGSLSWYTTQVGGNPSSTAPTPPTTSSLPPTTYYYVSQTVNGCEGPRASIAVTINPKPAQPTVTSSFTYCQNTTAQALTATGQNLKWYSDATITTTIPTPIPSTSNPGPTAYYVSQTDGNGCESNRASITVTVIATPNAPGVTSLSLCQNAPTVALATAVTSGSNLKWYTDPTTGTGSTVAPTLSTAAVGSKTYYVSQTLNGCESDRASIVVTIKTLPLAPTVSSNPVTYCQGAIADPLSATASNGGSLNWYNTQTGGVASSTALVPQTSSSLPPTTLYYVSQTVDGCEGPRATLVVTINPKPAQPTVVSSLTYCQNTTAPALTATGNALLWYTSSTGGPGSTTAPVPSTSDPQTPITYYVSQTNTNGCESDRASITVTIVAKPSAPGVSSLSLCLNATANSLTATTGGSLNWYGMNATGGTGSSLAPTPVTSATGTVTYYVSQRVNGCEGDRAGLDVTIKPLPAAPVASVTSFSYCQNAVAAPLAATGSMLNWYINQGGVESPLGQATPTPSTTAVGTITYSVSQRVNGCEGPKTTITVTISPRLPKPTVVSSLTYCQSATTTAPALTATGTGTLKWYSDPTSTTAIPTPTPSTDTPGPTVYYVSQIDANGCESDRASITVTIIPKPLAPGVSSLSLCQNAVATALTASLSPGGTLNWYAAASGGTAIGVPTPPTNTVGTTSYYVSQSVNGCESPRVNLDVTIKPLPVAPTVTNSAPSFCQNGVATALSATPATGGTLNWYINQGGVLSPLGQVAPIPSTATVGVLTYAVSQSVNGCEGLPASIAVTIKALPAAPTVSASSVTFCQGTVAQALIVLVSPGGTPNWYTVPTGGTSSPFAPVPLTDTPGITTYYVSQSVNDCESPRVPIIVITKRTPSVPTVGAAPIYCQGGTATALSAVAPDGGSLSWYTTLTGGTPSPTPPTPPVNTVGVVTYYVSQNLDGCESGRVSLTADIKAAPAAPFATASVAYCQGAAAVPLTATPTGGVLNWYSEPTGGSGSTVAPTPSTSSPGSTPYYVSQIDANGCESVRSVVTVKVNAPPAVPSTVPVTYCQGIPTAPLTAILTGGVSLNWYTAAVGGVASPVAPTPASISPGSTPYYVSQTDVNGCESSRNVVLVTVTASPAAPAVAAIDPVCQNGPSFALQAAGENLKWYTDPTTTASLGSAVVQSTVQPGTFIYYVSQTVNSCEGARAPSQVVVNALPAAPIVANLTACQDAVVQPLTATGTGLEWYDVNDNLIAAPTPVTKVDVAQTYTYKVAQTLNGCTSPKATFTYTVNVTPLPTVVPVVAYCQNSLINTPLQATGSNLKWTDPTGVVSANAPIPSTIAVTTGSSYFVTQTSALGCESRPAEIKVAVNAQATAKLDGNASVYLGSPALLTLTLTGAGPYSYTLSDGTSGIAETSATSPITTKQVSVTPAATTTYTIAAISNACGVGPSSGAATVTVKAPTITTNALLSSSVCTGAALNVTFSTTGEFVTGNAFTVEIASIVGDSASRKYIPISNGVVSGPFINTTIPNTIAPGQYYVRVVASNAPYSIGGTISPTVLTVRPLPTASFSVSKKVIYQGESVVLVFSLGGDGPWTGTYSAGTEVRAFGTTTSVYSATLTPATTTTYKLLTIASTNGCAPGKIEGADTTTVHVNVLTAEEDPFVNSVKVYPVPTEGAVTVDIDLPLQSKPAELRLVSPRGHVTEQVTTKKRQTILDLNKEPAGTYLLYITIGDRSTVRKVLKL